MALQGLASPQLQLRNLLGLLGAVQLYFGLVLGQLPFILGVPRH